MEKKIVTEKEEMYIREAIKRQFYLQGVKSVVLSIEAIYNLVRNLHYRVNYMDIKRYLESIGYRHTVTPQYYSYVSSYPSCRHDLKSNDYDLVYRFSYKDFLIQEEIDDFERITWD